MDTMLQKEISAIRINAEKLEMHLLRTSELTEHTESLRTDLILSILASDFTGQELIRRVDEARTCAPDLLREVLKTRAIDGDAQIEALDAANRTRSSRSDKGFRIRSEAAEEGRMQIKGLGNAYAQAAEEMKDEYAPASPELRVKLTDVEKRVVAFAQKASMSELMTKHGGFYVPEKGYEKLFDVLIAAHDQAAKGKGRDRHANNLPFHEQRMQQISTLLNSPDGMAYQVAKKVAEGLQMPNADARERELLGAIVYTAGIIIWLRNQPKVEG